MSILYFPPQDYSLDLHVEDLDSFELSDEQNMSDDYMSHGDAETKIFGSSDSSSNCKPDTTTSPPSKIKLRDPSISSFSLGCQFVCPIQSILAYLTHVSTKERCLSTQ